MTEQAQQTASKAWGDRLQALKNLPPVLKIVWDSGPWVVGLGLFYRVLVSVMPVCAGIVTKKIIDHIQEIAQRGAHYQGFSDYLWKLVVLEFILVVALNVFSRVIDYYDRVLADRYTRHVSIQVMEHASALDLQAYENPVYYDRLERARVQATDRLAMIQQLGRLFQQVVTTAAWSATIFYYSPLLLLVLVLCLIPAFLGESHFAFLNYALNFRQTPVKRELDYLRQVGGSKEAAKELKLFGLSDFLTKRFTRLSDDILAQNLSLARRRVIAATPLSILSTSGYYLSYIWVIYKTVQGQTTYGDFVLLTTSVTNAQSNISQLFSTLSGIADQALFLTDLLAFFKMEPTVVSKPDAIPAPRPITQGFDFQNVSFHYPGVDRVILDGLNFRLEPGERIALIGQNGQGKTTIVKLMTRLYDPTGGRILLDGVDLRDYSIEDLCREIGVIFQDFMRYEMTARENIAVGRIEFRDDDTRIHSAAEKSLADGVIEKLGGGYEQMLGRRFETGVDLSGGAHSR